MKIFHSPSEVGALRAVVATIGNFDGVHRGHQWVIAQVNARARALGLRSLAITFDPHPVRVLRPEIAHSLITPLAQKLELLGQTGLDATLVLPFTEELSRWTAEAFARDILRDACCLEEVHEGETFRFGAGGTGSMQTFAELGLPAQAYPPLVLRGGPVSSSRIRSLLAEGNMSEARALLGRPFAVRSTPASGRGFGTRYTVPTINLAGYDELLPAHGVYITTLAVGAEKFQAVTNVGNRPTFGADSFAVESHLLNFKPVELLESTPLELTFLKRLRPEMRWADPESLRAQIMKDVGQAQRYFRLACR